MLVILIKKRVYCALMINSNTFQPKYYKNIGKLLNRIHRFLKNIPIIATPWLPTFNELELLA